MHQYPEESGTPTDIIRQESQLRMSSTVPINQDFSLSDDEYAATGQNQRKGKRKRKQNKKKFRRRGGVAVDDWASWSSHLGSRKSPPAPEAVFSAAKRSALLWSVPDGAREETLRLVEALDRPRRSTLTTLAEQIEPWLAKVASREAGVSLALESLAWCHALPELAAAASPETWWRLLGQLTDISRDAAGLDLSAAPLTQQMLSGELPLTLAWLLPEVERCRDLAPAARESLSRGIEELLDGEGLPHARNLALLRPLLASWTRAVLLARSEGVDCFRGDSLLQYEWLVRQAIRMCRYDGSQVFAHDQSGVWSKKLFELAVEASGDSDDARIASLATRIGKATTARNSRKALPEAAVYSEWAETAILRSSWDRRREHLAVTFHDRHIVSELNCGRHTVWSGDCSAVIEIDGKLLEPASDWEEVCWHSDDDLDYLELELNYTDGWKVQRQYLLARDDRFLFTADVLLSNKSAAINYRRRLPLCDDVRFAADEESREGFLEGNQRISLVMPLALPEWRIEHSLGKLSQQDGDLELSMTTEAARLYAPLFIDLKPSRTRQQFTWRRLTVAENLELQPADVAAGYRVQVGKRQWLFYRSLAPTAPRTLLGQHLISEMLVARFDQDGEIDELLEIE